MGAGQLPHLSHSDDECGPDPRFSCQCVEVPRAVRSLRAGATLNLLAPDLLAPDLLAPAGERRSHGGKLVAPDRRQLSTELSPIRPQVSLGLARARAVDNPLGMEPKPASHDQATPLPSIFTTA